MDQIHAASYSPSDDNLGRRVDVFKQQRHSRRRGTQRCAVGQIGADRGRRVWSSASFCRRARSSANRRTRSSSSLRTCSAARHGSAARAVRARRATVRTSFSATSSRASRAVSARAWLGSVDQGRQLGPSSRRLCRRSRSRAGRGRRGRRDRRCRAEQAGGAAVGAELGDAPGQLVRREIQQNLHVEGADLRVAQEFSKCLDVCAGCPQAVERRIAVVPRWPRSTRAGAEMRQRRVAFRVIESSTSRSCSLELTPVTSRNRRRA